jgi:L-threonylcarbamoyladenylate synthase
MVVVDEAAAVLVRGGLAVFPTESVYGLGADATSPAAVERLVAVRGRDEGKPILVLASDLRMVTQVVRHVPLLARRLAARLWPGALTLVLPARDGLPAALTAGTGTIGVRMPDHATARALVAALGRPVTAPSANPPGASPAVTVAEARAYFGDRVQAYVDGGALGGGVSTVVAMGGSHVRVLRAGLVATDAIERALAED